MVGNLESGDYTIVSFSVSPTITRSGTQNISRREAPQNYSAFSSKLKFDIYYTDNIGERRIVNMELPLNMNAGNFSSAQGIMGFGRRNVQTSSWSNWYTFVVVIAALIILFGLYKKYPRQIKNFLNKTKVKLKKISKKTKAGTSNSDTTPNWIKNLKGKEKKK